MMRWSADRTRRRVYMRMFRQWLYLVQCCSCFLVQKCQQVRRRAPQDLLDTQHRWWKGWMWFVGKSEIQEMFPTVIVQCKMGTPRWVFSLREKVGFSRICPISTMEGHTKTAPFYTKALIGFKFHYSPWEDQVLRHPFRYIKTWR